MTVSTISLLLAVIAILVSLGSVYYTRRQTQLIEKEQTRKQREDKVTAEWVAKFELAVDAAVKIAPSWIHSGAGQTNAYGLLFPDPAFRQLIEAHLIVTDRSRSSYSPRAASVEQLRMPIVQQTIQGVLDCVKKFKETDPENARKLGL
jgi:hypothetical protein